MGGIAGRVMPLPKGEYTSISVYNTLDMVRYNNCLWMAKKNQIVNVTPSKENEDAWMQITELSDIDVIRNNIAELKNSASVAQTDITALRSDVNNLDSNVDALSSKIDDLETQIPTGPLGSLVTIGDTEPETCNTLWFNTSGT